MDLFTNSGIASCDDPGSNVTEFIQVINDFDGCASIMNTLAMIGAVVIGQAKARVP